MDLHGKTIGAARDMAIASIGHPYSGIPDYAEFGLDPSRPYFNAGVLVVDLDRWRSRDYGPIARRHAQARPRGNADQDVLNLLLHDDWHSLDLRWNVQGSLVLLHEIPADPWVPELATYRDALLEQPAVLHFSGDIKPWKPMSVHPFAPHWRSQLRRSRWYSWPEWLRWWLPFGAKRMAVKLLTRIGKRPVRESLKVAIPGAQPTK
jgi:lipopolysaccharide biosynthesis glycosyltransferase